MICVLLLSLSSLELQNNVVSITPVALCPKCILTIHLDALARLNPTAAVWWLILVFGFQRRASLCFGSLAGMRMRPSAARVHTVHDQCLLLAFAFLLNDFHAAPKHFALQERMVPVLCEFRT